MAKHSISEAARLTGKARSTLQKHIKENRLSKEIGPNGKPCIDTAELIRLYGELQDTSDRTSRSTSQQTTPKQDRQGSITVNIETAIELGMLREKVGMLKDQIEDLKNDRDHWREESKAKQKEIERLLPAPSKPSEGLFRKLSQFFSGG